jgi:hypothetical protein
MEIIDQQKEQISNILKETDITPSHISPFRCNTLWAINMGMTNEDSDEIPGCMSTIIGIFIKMMEKYAEKSLLNSAEYKDLIVISAFTGKDPIQEKKRLEILFEYIWKTVFPYVQPIAEKHGFGDYWKGLNDGKDMVKNQEARNAINHIRRKKNWLNWLSNISDALTHAHDAIEVLNGQQKWRNINCKSDVVAVYLVADVIRSIRNANYCVHRESRTGSQGEAIEAVEHYWNHLNICKLLENLTKISIVNQKLATILCGIVLSLLQ